MKLSVQTRFAAEEKSAILELVAVTRARTGWTLRRVLKRLGLSRGRYHEWRKRAAGEGRLADRSTAVLSRSALLPEERQAITAYALAHPKDGYRRLTWQMVDADIAYVSPSSVYRTLSEADLLYRWKRSTHSGEAPARPTRPNERWHTDLMYLRIEDSWYFLVTVIDAYSRYVVHWDLLSSMTAAEVRLVIQEAIEQTGAQPQIVSDNGSQFTSADFKQLIRQFELEHIRIRTYHPESNGVIERFHRSTREALAESDLVNLSRVRELIAQWVHRYNHTRLHAGLNYLPPVVYYTGDPQQRLRERNAKLALGRQRRAQGNRQQDQAA
jgi:putative transposase